MLLAEDFGGLAFFVLGVPLALVTLTLVSFFASAQGHWSGPVLATPAILLGLFLTSTLASAPEGDMVLLWLLFGSPLALGIGSVALWSVRRGTPIALSAAPALTGIAVAVLVTVHMLRVNRLAAFDADRAEHARFVQMRRKYQAEESAALAADPDHADAVKARLKPDRDALEEQRLKWQHAASEMDP